MSQNYQYVPKLCDLSVKIAPDVKENRFSLQKKFKYWAPFGIKISIFSEQMGALGDTTQFCEKNMGSLGEIVKIYGVFG